MSTKQRDKKGQSMITLGLIVGVLILLAGGILGFEINRLELGRQQLRAACDAAALAGAATLASSDNLDPLEAHSSAMNTALTSFQQNTVVGHSLADATLAGGANDRPPVNASSLFIEFLDPHDERAPVDLGDPKGKIVRITAAFGMEPAFGRFLGLGDVPVYAMSSGGVPALDVVLCFDVSASIDDQTPVTFVRRQWNAAQGKTNYIIPPTRSGAVARPNAEGRIYDIIGPPPTGSALDGVYPQTLQVSSNTSSSRWPLYFSERGGTSPSAVGLRGTPNAGSPPGNCPPGVAGTGIQYTYTDVVVNIDGQTHFNGCTVNGYDFPDLGTLVEAARGNLENMTVFQNSRARDSVDPRVSPRAGYQAAYFAAAKRNLHPLYDAQVAAGDFFTIMNTNTDGHFSLVCFSSEAGTGPSDTDRMYNVDSTYSNAGQSDFPKPLIPLNPAVGSTQHDTIQTAIPTTGPISGTNIGDALYRAVLQLRSNSRPGAKKAIVLFTDGEPTAGGPLHSDPWTNARRAAVEAKNSGIPIYSIGLAQNPEIIPSETAILNDTNPNTSSGGVSGIAGNGGKFFLVTNNANLRLTFENIARQLVQLVR